MPIRGLRAEAHHRAEVVYDNEFPDSEWVGFLPPGHVTLKNVLFSPLVVAGKAIGLLGLANKPGGFTDADARLAGVFGEFAAASLNSSRIWRALTESEEKYRAIFDEARDGIVLADAETGLIVDCNRELERQSGRSRAELKEIHVWELASPAQRRIANRILTEVRANGVAASAELWLQRPDGDRIPIELTVNRVEVEGRPHLQSISRDITDRKEAERALRDSEKKYRALFDEARDGIVLIDAETGLVVDCNREWERQTGRSLVELGGMRIWELLPPGQVEAAREKFSEIQEKGFGASAELSYLRPDGARTPFEFNSKRVEIGGRQYHQSVTRDITERKQMEEHLQQSQVLASLGEMTAGIAHEVNNPLAAILLYSELIDRAGLTPAARKDLKVIRSEAKRASNIMKGLLTYSRKAEPITRRLDIQKILKKVVGMRKYQEHVRDIDVEVKLADGSLRILGSSAQLTQLFMNIIVNAEEAVENSDRKRIVVTSEAHEGMVRISIADSGIGIPEERLTQVFVPFFSTKPTGKGTGLGLATCHGIVTAHGGSIRAENNDMGGATFIVELPLAK